MGASQHGLKPWNTEAEESSAFGTVTRQQPVKIKKTGKN
jgi:hypothetical protein